MRKKKNKLSVIGPVMPPYRGGIAQYNSFLLGELRRVRELDSFSFKTQYPKLLYPGDTDKSSNDIDKNVNYSLSIYSPLSWLLTARAIIKQKNKAVIIHWFTFVWAVPYMLIISYLKSHNVKVFLLVHNLSDHDSKNLKSKLMRRVASMADGYIVHTKEQVDEVASLGGNKPVFQRIIPVYGNFPKVKKSKSSQADLELLFFGFIRPYKGVDVLVEAMKIVEKESSVNVHLNIVGEAWGDEKEKITNAISKIKSIDAKIEYVTDDEAAEYVSSADVIVLPYKSATGSAVVSLAYNYNKPVIASSVPGLKEAVIDRETGWLFEPENVQDLAKLILSISRKDAKALEPKVESFKRQHTWKKMAQEISQFIDGLI